MWELTKSFRFEAAHTISGTTLGTRSEEIHGNSFRAEISVRGKPDPASGMMVPYIYYGSHPVAQPADTKKSALDKPTLEHLACFIWDRARGVGELTRVTVFRDSCNEACSYFGPQ